MTSPILDPAELLREGDRLHSVYTAAWRASVTISDSPNPSVEVLLDQARIQLDLLQEIFNEGSLNLAEANCSKSFQRAFTRIGLTTPELFTHLGETELTNFIRWSSKVMLGIIEKESSEA